MNRTRSLKPIKSLEPLNDSQQLELAQFLESHTYQETIEFARDKFKILTCKSALERFRRRNCLDLLHETSAESRQAAAELSEYAATGAANFTAATLHLIQQRAFNLALSAKDSDETSELRKTFQMILGYLNADTRARLATVQERKCDLRQRELEQRSLSRQEHAAALPETNSAPVDLAAAILHETPQERLARREQMFRVQRLPEEKWPETHARIDRQREEILKSQNTEAPQNPPKVGRDVPIEPPSVKQTPNPPKAPRDPAGILTHPRSTQPPMTA